MMSEPPIRVKLIGIPQIFCKSEITHINRKKVRALFYYLAAEHRAVSRSELTRLLWPEKSYNEASQSLSIHLSYLKNELGEDVLYTSSDSVILREMVTSDLMEVEERVASESLDDLFRALNLLEGDFLQGFYLNKNYAFEEWSTLFSTRIGKLRSEIILTVINRLMDNGRYTEAETLLEKAGTQDPLNEALCRLRMINLEKAGLRSSVAKVYFDFVALLDDELGLPPSQETSDCYLKIISKESVAHFPFDENAMSKNKKEPFFGREIPLQMLHDNDKPVVMVCGNSGMGKTSLVTYYMEEQKTFEVKLAYRQQNFNVLYYEITQFLRSILYSEEKRPLLETVSQKMSAESWTVLSQLVPGYAELKQGSYDIRMVSTIQIMTAIEQFLFVLSEGRNGIVFVDDIQYADESSLQLLLYLIRQESLRNLKFICCYRPDLASQPVSAFLNALYKEDLMTTIELEKLEDEALVGLLKYYHPEIDAKDAEKLVAISAGNPFWMKAIINGMDSGYTEINGKLSLKKLFQRMFNALPTASLQVLCTMAVMGDSCDQDVFLDICELLHRNPEDTLRDLFLGGLVGKQGDHTVAFAHSKVYEYTLEYIQIHHLDEETFHNIAASALVHRGKKQLPDQKIAVVAEHYSKSNHPKYCVPYAIRAGIYAMTLSRTAEACHYFKLAHRYSDAPGKYEVIVCLIINMIESGNNYEADVYLNQAIAEAKHTGHRSHLNILTALHKLSRYSEFAEIRQGAAPSYFLDLDPSIEILLKEALADKTYSSEVYMTGYIYTLLYTYYYMSGALEEAEHYMHEVISMAYPLMESDNRNAMLLLYSAVQELIVLSNAENNEKVQDFLQFEEHIFNRKPLTSFLLINKGMKALMAVGKGNTEDGVQMMYSAISEIRRYGNEMVLAIFLTTLATILRYDAPEKSYSMNYEAYQISREIHAKYTQVRSLLGLVLTSTSLADAEKYYQQMKKLTDKIGSESAQRKLKSAEKVIEKKKQQQVVNIP